MDTLDVALDDEQADDCGAEAAIISFPWDPASPAMPDPEECPPPEDCPPGQDEGCGGLGMPVWGVIEPTIRLWVKDVPLYYPMSDGRVFPLVLRYRQGNAAHPTKFFSVGNQWECSWRLYTANPTTDPSSLRHRGIEGLWRSYRKESQTNQTGDYGRGAFAEYVTASLQADGRLPWVKMAERRYLSRSYAGSRVIGTTNYLFLDEFFDRHGRRMKFNYTNPSPSVVKLLSVVDFDGRTNHLRYDNSAFPLHITKVEGPHGLTTHLNYDASGNLIRIVDMAGIATTFAYGTNALLTHMVTSYGTTRFQYDSAESTNNQVRRLLAAQPDGSTNLFAYLASASFLGAGSLQPPLNTAVPVLPNLFGYSPHYDAQTAQRNSFFWGPRQMQALTGSWTTLHTNDYRLARLRHWMVGKDPVGQAKVVRRLLLERQPSPDGQSEGHQTWYTYGLVTNATYRMVHAWPIQAAEQLPNGETRYVHVQRNDWGQPTNLVRTYSGNGGVATNHTRYSLLGTPIPRLYQVSGPELDAQGNPRPMRGYGYNTANQITAVTSFVRSSGTWQELTTYGYSNWVNAVGVTNRNLISIRSPNGLILTNVLDGVGSVTARRWYAQQTTPGALLATNLFTWHQGRPAISTDARGLQVTYSWDALGRLSWQSFPDQSTNVYQYAKADGVPFPNSTDSLQLLDLTKSKDRLGNWTTWTYDALRRPTAVSWIKNGASVSTTYQWCGCGSLEAVIDPTGNPTHYLYDFQGRLTNVVYPGSRIVQIAWNELGQPTYVSNATGAVDFHYNHQGLLSAVSNRFGVWQERTFDLLDRPTNLVLASGARYALTYDSLGRLLSRTNVSVGGRERFAYTANVAAATSYTNALGTNVVLLGYDLFGRVTTQGFVYQSGTNWLSARSNSFLYTPAGDLQRLRDGLNHDTTWSYDAYGRPTSKLIAGTLTWTNSYNANGWLTNHWTPQKGLTQYTYDEASNLRRVDYPSDTDLILGYDAANRLTSLVDGVGTHAFTWTAWGALASEDGPWVQDTVTYGDNSSLLRQALSLAQPSASDWTQTYGYDESWRLHSVTSPAGSFAYNHKGASALVNRLTLLNTSYLTNLFDGAGRLLSSRLLTSTQTVLNAHTYQYNAAHQRTRQTLTEGNYWDYGYDALGQLTSAKAKESGGTTRLHEQLTYGYDKAGNLTKRTNNALVQTFTLTNSLNQLNGVSRSGTFTVAGLVQGTPTNVTVKDNANPAQVATVYGDKSFARAGVSLLSGTNTFTAVARDGSNRLATNIAISYLPSSISSTYDANGNLTSDGRRTFEYDDADQLKAVQVANAWRTEFQSDALGRRRIKREFVWLSGLWNLASEVRYVYDHLLVLQERDGNNVPLVTYTRGQDLSGSLQTAGGIGGLLARTDHRLLAIGDPSAHAYYHADAGGNITALVDSRQRLVARYRYDPFGNLLGLAGPLVEANLYRFGSKELHPASGLYYYGFRFYDPSLQRWVNRDPLGEAGGSNLYRFVRNTPLTSLDPFGLEDFLMWSGCDFAAPDEFADAVDPVVEAGFGKAYTGCTAANLPIALAENTCRGTLDLLRFGVGAAEGTIEGIAADLQRAGGIMLLTAGPVVRCTGAAKGGTIPLWRAVKPEELADIQAQGVFRNLGSAEGKYFSTTAEGAASYAKQAVKGFGDPPYTLIRTDVPNNLLPRALTVDRNVPAVVLPNNVLPTLKPQVLDYFPVPPP